MGKDPAFLFYPNDWLGGTLGMTLEEKGAYMEVLMLQFNRGHMTSDMIGQVIGQIWVKIKDKFEKDENGLYFNRRLDEEKEKRKRFINSRLNNKNGKNQYKNNGHINAHMNGHMTSHMENENENENIIIKGVENFENNFKKAFDDITIDRYRLIFTNCDILRELSEFRLKCDNNPNDYHNRDLGGLRNGFQNQLKQANQKNNKKNGNKLDHSEELQRIYITSQFADKP